MVGHLPRLAIFILALTAFLSVAFAQTKPDKDYLVYVVSESADKIALIRFGPNGARIDHQVDTGDMPVDIDGPHGIVISPDRRFYYVSIAHGRPFGLVWKYSTKDDSVLGKATLGYFPATVDVTPQLDLLADLKFFCRSPDLNRGDRGNWCLCLGRDGEERDRSNT